MGSERSGASSGRDYDPSQEISALLALKPQLSKDRNHPWVVFAQSKHQGSFGEFSQAVDFAVEKFPDGRFVVRDVSDEEPTVPLVVVET